MTHMKHMPENSDILYIIKWIAQIRWIVSHRKLFRILVKFINPHRTCLVQWMYNKWSIRADIWQVTNSHGCLPLRWSCYRQAIPNLCKWRPTARVLENVLLTERPENVSRKGWENLERKCGHWFRYRLRRDGCYLGRVNITASRACRAECRPSPRQELQLCK